MVIIVGFRPEHFRLAEDMRETEKVTFKFRVENVEYLGAEFILAGLLVGGKADGKKVIARLLLGHSYEVGTTYDFAVPERHLKFFDRTTEKKVPARAADMAVGAAGKVKSIGAAQSPLLGFAMFSPAVLYIGLLIGAPFVLAVFYAFSDARIGGGEMHYVGLENFRSILQSPSFIRR